MGANEAMARCLGQEDAHWELDIVNRFELVVNNFADALTYTSPSGTNHMIDAGTTDMCNEGGVISAG